MLPIITLLIYIIFSLILSFYDLKTLHIPLLVLYSGLFINILLSFLFDRSDFFYHLFGMIFMFFFFFLIRVLTKGGMGYGDIQFALYCGFVSGFPNFIYAALFSSLLGIFFHLIFIKKSQKIPFIPSMMLGTIICIICFI